MFHQAIKCVARMARRTSGAIKALQGSWSMPRMPENPSFRKFIVCPKVQPTESAVNLVPLSQTSAKQALPKSLVGRRLGKETVAKKRSTTASAGGTKTKAPSKPNNGSTEKSSKAKGMKGKSSSPVGDSCSALPSAQRLGMETAAKKRGTTASAGGTKTKASWKPSNGSTGKSTKAKGTQGKPFPPPVVLYCPAFILVAIVIYGAKSFQDETNGAGTASSSTGLCHDIHKDVDDDDNDNNNECRFHQPPMDPSHPVDKESFWTSFWKSFFGR